MATAAPTPISPTPATTRAEPLSEPDDAVPTTANDVVTLPRSEIRKIEATAISMMPEGLIANLTEQQTRDLLYYLTRPGQVPLPVGAK